MDSIIARKNWENEFIKCRIVGRVVALTKETWHYQKKKEDIYIYIYRGTPPINVIHKFHSFSLILNFLRITLYLLKPDVIYDI